MSVPARQVPLRAPGPADAPLRRSGPRQPPVPHARPPSPQERRTHASARRRVHGGFLVFTGVIVTALIVGVVTLNAFLAQAAFQMRSAEARLVALRGDQLGLTDEAARLSSPIQVAAWARQHKMVTPGAGEVYILRVPGSGR